MDMTIARLISFNEFLDATLDPKTLDEEFITSRQVELESISKNSDAEYFPIIALSYAKLMELTVLLAGRCADSGQLVDFGDIVANPRHMDVCILNTGLIKEDCGITDGIPLWFKRRVREIAGSQYSEDMGRMVVAPSLLLQFVENGLLLRTVKKERHGRLSDQFKNCIPGASQLAFSEYVEDVTPVERNPGKVGCGYSGAEGLDVASWLAGSTVLNIVKGTLKADLMDVLREFLSDDYLGLIDKKFEKALNSLHYVSIGRKNFANFPYNDEVKVSEWAEINNTLCHFTLDAYGVLQSELDKTISDPYYRSRFLDVSLCHMPISPDAIQAQMVGNIM